MVVTSEEWSVTTFKNVTDADGNKTEKQFTEVVTPDHKLLEQSYSPTFIKGKPARYGEPGCTVMSIMVAFVDESSVMIKTPIEDTVPEYEPVTQAVLKTHYEKQLSNASNRLLSRHWRPKALEWLANLRVKAVEYTTKGKSAEYAKVVSNYLSTYTRGASSYLSGWAWKIIATIVLISLLFALLKTDDIDLRDKKLEKSYQTHRDIIKMLHTTRTVRGLSYEITKHAITAESIGVQIGNSDLPNKDTIARRIDTMAKSMHTMERQLQTYRRSVRHMAIGLQQDHETTLMDIGKVSHRKLRKQWVETTLKLRDTLFILRREAGEIEAKLDDILVSLRAIENELFSSRKIQVNSQKQLNSGWLGTLSVFGERSPTNDDEIELINSFLPEVRAAKENIHGLDGNIRTVYDNLAHLGTATWMDKTIDFVRWFVKHQRIAHDSFGELVEALQYELDTPPEPGVATVTITTTPLPTAYDAPIFIVT